MLYTRTGTHLDQLQRCNCWVGFKVYNVVIKCTLSVQVVDDVKVILK